MFCKFLLFFPKKVCLWSTSLLCPSIRTNSVFRVKNLEKTWKITQFDPVSELKDAANAPLRLLIHRSRDGPPGQWSFGKTKVCHFVFRKNIWCGGQLQSSWCIKNLVWCIECAQTMPLDILKHRSLLSLTTHHGEHCRNSLPEAVISPKSINKKYINCKEKNRKCAIPANTKKTLTGISLSRFVSPRSKSGESRCPWVN